MTSVEELCSNSALLHSRIALRDRGLCLLTDSFLFCIKRRFVNGLPENKLLRAILAELNLWKQQLPRTRGKLN